MAAIPRVEQYNQELQDVTAIENLLKRVIRDQSKLMTETSIFRPSLIDPFFVSIRTVVAADSLAKRDVFRLPDPFAVLTIDGEQTNTTTAIKVSFKPLVHLLLLEVELILLSPDRKHSIPVRLREIRDRGELTKFG